LKRRSILGWAAAILAIGALTAGISLWPSRYRAHAGGRIRFDTETGRSEVRMQGQWVPLPEVKLGKLQARTEAAMSALIERRIEQPALPAAALAVPPPQIVLPDTMPPMKAPPFAPASK
jgi:hypothetical protein